MNIKQLIEKLQDYSPELEVKIMYSLNGLSGSEKSITVDRVVDLSPTFGKFDEDSMKLENVNGICLIGSLCEK